MWDRSLNDRRRAVAAITGGRRRRRPRARARGPGAARRRATATACRWCCSRCSTSSARRPTRCSRPSPSSACWRPPRPGRADRLRELLAADPDAIRAAHAGGLHAARPRRLPRRARGRARAARARRRRRRRRRQPVRRAPRARGRRRARPRDDAAPARGGRRPERCASSGGFTPLHEAAHTDDVEMARLLLAHGADPAIAADDGRDSARIAADDGSAARRRAARRLGTHGVAGAEVLVFLLVAVALLAGAACASTCRIRSCSSSAASLLGLVPGLPVPDLDPDLVFFAFLPPLLYAAAFQASAYELRANVVPISRLADRARARHGRRGRGRRALVAGAPVGRGVRPRRGARPDRPGVGDRGHAPRRRADADRDDPRGRGAGQRRHRPDRVQDRARRGRRDDRCSAAGVVERLRAHRRRRDRDRPRGRAGCSRTCGSRRASRRSTSCSPS